MKSPKGYSCRVRPAWDYRLTALCPQAPGMSVSGGRKWVQGGPSGAMLRKRFREERGTLLPEGFGRTFSPTVGG